MFRSKADSGLQPKRDEETPLMKSSGGTGLAATTTVGDVGKGGKSNRQESLDRTATTGQSAPTSSSPQSGTPTPATAPQEKSFLGWLADLIVYGPNPLSMPATKTKGPWKWWHSWDVSSNSKEIFIRERDTDLNVLDGVRALAYLWVLNDHLYQALGKSITGFSDWFGSQDGIMTAASGNKGDEGVTSFFVLSGFLIPFILTRLVRSKKERYLSAWTAVEFLFRRYMRLAPTLILATFVAMAYGCLNTGNEAAYSTFCEPCLTGWWENFIFMNNYNGFFGYEDCYDSVWTISVEMQLYVLTIPVVYCYVWEKEYGYLAAFFWTLTSLLLRVGMSEYCDETGAPFGVYVYLPAYTRAAEYGVGMGLYFLWDYYLADKKRRAELALQPSSNLDINLKIVFWFTVVAIAAFAFYYLSVDEDAWWSGSDNQYYSFSYFLWGAGLSSVIYISVDGTFWPLTWFLSWYVWFPIASLAYSAGVLNIVICYMYGDFILAFYGADFEWDINTSQASYFFIYLQVMFLSLSVGLMMSYFIERPGMNLAKAVKFSSGTGGGGGDN